MILRPYQTELLHNIYESWRKGHQNVLACLPTGAGKTVIFAKILKEHESVPTCVVAHRQELLSQISLALGREKIYHTLAAPPNVVKKIVAAHVNEFRKSFYYPNSTHVVAGVDTLVRKDEQPWMKNIKLWVQDEAHHIQQNNKWGKVLARFPNAKGLGVTATPERADKQGLSRSTHGYMDVLIVGPSMRELINLGFLSDYRVFSPNNNLNLAEVQTAKDGDYNKNQLNKAVKKSTITGDVVSHYKRFAFGKRGITFTISIEAAEEMAEAYKSAGVPAAAVSSKTPDSERSKMITLLKQGRLLQLVNVDLFGEGFDLPAIKSVSMARPTQSFAVFVQQFGRALRILSGEDNAIIFDHVGNIVQRHGLPDDYRPVSLDGIRKKEKQTSKVNVQNCGICAGVFYRYLKTCPYCGNTVTPVARETLETVDGDLSELNPEALATLRNKALLRLSVNPDMEKEKLLSMGYQPVVANSVAKRHRERLKKQNELRETIARWAGYQNYKSLTDIEVHKKFYLTFGIDVLSAQALGTKDADGLLRRIKDGKV